MLDNFNIFKTDSEHVIRYSREAKLLFALKARKELLYNIPINTDDLTFYNSKNESLKASDWDSILMWFIEFGFTKYKYSSKKRFINISEKGLYAIKELIQLYGNYESRRIARRGELRKIEKYHDHKGKTPIKEYFMENYKKFLKTKDLEDKKKINVDKKDLKNIDDIMKSAEEANERLKDLEGINKYIKRTYLGETFLHYAVRAQDYEALKKITSVLSYVDGKISYGKINALRTFPMATPLSLAFNLNDCKLMKYLIGYGADIDFPIYKERTLLNELCFWHGRTSGNDEYGYYGKYHEIVTKENIENIIPNIKILLDLGAYINTKDIYGMTPLYYSLINENNSEVIKLLIENGAVIDSNLYYELLKKKDFNPEYKKILKNSKNIIYHGSKF